MPKTLGNHKEAVHVVEVIHHGEQIILPEAMDLDDAIQSIRARKAYLQEEISVNHEFTVFPWDGAVALSAVLTKKFGWSQAVAVPGFFGNQPPQMINVDTDYNKSVSVAWGRFNVPTLEYGYIECSSTRKDGLIIFAISASVLRKDAHVIEDICKMIGEELAANSIYRGKAFKMRFRDEKGNKLGMPEPKFMNTDDVNEEMLVYPEDTRLQIETNLFTPIKRIHDCIANGIPVKRGVLLGGTFGTGKTMAAKVASKFAIQQGITYLYITRADELADAVAFAKIYADPACVIFCEDIDRAMDVSNSERTAGIDDILNIIDGIDTKSANIITVLTTNNLDGITPAMLRPGRLDAVIDVLPPDALAAEKLVRLLLGDALKANEDLTEVGKQLDGVIPAVITEVTKRAKLAQVTLQEPGTIVSNITAAALLTSAKSMKSQLDLLYRQEPEDTNKLDLVLRKMITEAVQTIHNPVVAEQVEAIHKRVV